MPDQGQGTDGLRDRLRKTAAEAEDALDLDDAKLYREAEAALARSEERVERIVGLISHPTADMTLALDESGVARSDATVVHDVLLAAVASLDAGEPDETAGGGTAAALPSEPSGSVDEGELNPDAPPPAGITDDAQVAVDACHGLPVEPSGERPSTVSVDDADYEEGVRCVVMPCCGFTFAAEFEDAIGGEEPTGEYTCPVCAGQPAWARPDFGPVDAEKTEQGDGGPKPSGERPERVEHKTKLRTIQFGDDYVLIYSRSGPTQLSTALPEHVRQRVAAMWGPGQRELVETLHAVWKESERIVLHDDDAQERHERIHGLVVGALTKAGVLAEPSTEGST